MKILKKMKAADKTWIYVIQNHELYIIRRNCHTWNTFQSLEEALKNAVRLQFLISERQRLLAA